MLFRSLCAVCSFFLLAGGLHGDDTSRAKLIGTWHDAASNTASDAIWSLEERGDAIRITHLLGGQKVEAVECNTLGRECDVKDSGHHVKVSMWFNGPKLVQMETRGSEVIKRRFAIVEKGDRMEIEVIPIMPAGKTEVVQLQRVSDSAAHQ